MTRPTIAIGALGGTIASTSSTGDGSAVVPTLDAAALAAAVPGLDDVASLRAETLAQLPSPSLDEAALLRALGWARAAVDDGAAGVVITQGTDTLEESAYWLDLFWDRPEPLVLTGAMRAPDAAGADGPANLLAAVRSAAAPASRDRGGMVVMADEVHGARWVAKADSLAPHAFVSAPFGPLGRVAEGEVSYVAPPARTAPLPLPPEGAEAGRVPIVTTHLGDDGLLLSMVDVDRVDAVVVAGFGAGHVSAPAAEQVGRLAASVPVVFATRTGAGPTGRAIYGYPGSEIDLQERGAVGAGWLTPLKARLLLAALTLTGPLERTRVADEFARRGGL